MFPSKSAYAGFFICLVALFLARGTSASVFAQRMNAAPCRNVVVAVNLANCFWNAWKTEDKELNAYYQIVSARLEGGELTDLRRAEKTWIAFRDENCKAEKALYEGGTAIGPAYNACMEEMTRHRLVELKTMYDWRVIK